MPDILTGIERIAGLIKRLVSFEERVIARMWLLCQQYQSTFPEDLQKKIKLKWVSGTLKWYIYKRKTPCRKPIRVVNVPECVAGYFEPGEYYRQLADFIREQGCLNQAKRVVRIALRHIKELIESYLAVQNISESVDPRKSTSQELTNLLIEVEDSLFNEALSLVVEYRNYRVRSPDIKKMLMLYQCLEKSRPLCIWYLRWRVKVPRRRVFWLKNLISGQFLQKVHASEPRSLFRAYEHELEPFAQRARSYNQRRYKAYRLLSKILERARCYNQRLFDIWRKIQCPWRGHG